VNWTPLYAAMAGSAAAVMGVLFVAVQLSAERLPAEVRHGWRAVSSCIFYLYLTAFFLPLWFLVPAFDQHGRAVITLVVAGIGVARTVRASIPIWHGVLRDGDSVWWQMLWYSVGPLAVYTLIIVEGERAYFDQWKDSTEEHVAILLIILFSLGLRNSWTLFVEAAFQARDSEPEGHEAQKGCRKSG
jgi:hypothetical protein